jgi:anti-sigma regulatory factor (Ser/Thr protein kinase)
MRSHAQPAGLLSHDALLYGSEDELLSTLVPFVAEGLDQAEAVIAVTTPSNSARLTDALGPAATQVAFVDRETWYQHPLWTIAGYRDVLDAHVGAGAGRVRVIGEVAFGDDPTRHQDWIRYESAVNRVFAAYPAWIVCPYDTRRLPGWVLDSAARTHPHVRKDGGRVYSRHYAPPHRVARELSGAATLDVPAAAPRITLGEPGDLAGARAWLRRQADHVGVNSDQVDALVAAAGELLTNALTHAAPPVTLRFWTTDDELHCEVSDHGSGVDDPLAGLDPPQDRWLPESGAGLWIVRHLSHRVELLPGRDGFSVRLSMRR